MEANIEKPFSIQLDRQKFPGYGRCIFCGSDGGEAKLRREHIIPRALGGNAEILDASCSDCESKTSHIDGALARSIFFELRVYEGIQSRRKTTTKIKHLPTTFQCPDGTRVTKKLPVKQRPITVGLPLLYQPAILLGINRPGETYLQTMHSITHIPKGFQPLSVLPEGGTIVIQKQFDLYSFARALAKIAYCFTVVTHGLDNFDPMDLPDLILGRYRKPMRYVGGTELPVPAPQPGHRHLVSMFETEGTDRRYVGAEIRLFAPFGAEGNGTVGLPIYRVVSGALF